jgi:hypothetical protein
MEPDLFAAGSYSRAMGLFDVRTREQLLLLEGHAGGITQVSSAVQRVCVCPACVTVLAATTHLCFVTAVLQTGGLLTGRQLSVLWGAAGRVHSLLGHPRDRPGELDRVVVGVARQCVAGGGSSACHGMSKADTR